MSLNSVNNPIESVSQERIVMATIVNEPAQLPDSRSMVNNVNSINSSSSVNNLTPNNVLNDRTDQILSSINAILSKMSLFDTRVGDLEKKFTAIPQENKDHELNHVVKTSLPNEFNSSTGGLIHGVAKTTTTSIETNSNSNLLNNSLTQFNSLINNFRTLKLPELTKSDKVNFERWKLSFEIQTKINSPLDIILFEEPSESWARFQQNYSNLYSSVKIPESELIRVYVSIHQVAYWQLFNAIKQVTTESILEQVGNHPDLDFSSIFVSNHIYPIQENAYILWNLVCERYLNKSIYSVVELHKKYFNLKYQFGSDPDLFMNEFRNAAAKISLFGKDFALSETTQALTILSNLPPQLESFKQQFYAKETIPKLEDIAVALRNFYASHNNSKTKTSTEGVNAVADKRKKAKRNKSKLPHSTIPVQDSNPSQHTPQLHGTFLLYEDSHIEIEENNQDETANSVISDSLSTSE